jgi:LacI family transcriptional regulator
MARPSPGSAVKSKLAKGRAAAVTQDGDGRRVVTINDVAALAGVSKSTVSKALNGKAEIPTETRDRVHAAAKQLRFRPNHLARALMARRSFTVGLMTTDTFGRFSIPLLMGAEDALRVGELAVLVCDSRDDPSREERYLEALSDRRVDGIIVAGRRTEPRPSLGSAASAPVVYAFQPSADPSDCSVVVDQYGGARLAVRHLLAQGRRSIAHVTGPRRHRAAVDRARGVTDELSEAGVRLLGRAGYGTWSESWGREFTARLLTAHPRVDGIFCGSDQIARGVVDALREVGRRIPDDVAVVGFDNWDVMALASRPPLTSIEMNLRTVGRVSAEFIMSAISSDASSGITTVPCSLVVRQSSTAQVDADADVSLSAAATAAPAVRRA